MTQGPPRPTSQPTRAPSVVVLAFHRVVQSPTRDHDIAWSSFMVLLDRIVRSPTTIALGDDPANRDGMPICLTFDDGTEDHLEVARELQSRGMSAIFFIPTAKVDQPSYLKSDEVRSMRELGHVIGAHSVHHVPLDGLSSEELVKEVAGSKSALEELVGASVDLFAPPGGVYAPTLEAELAKAGYAAARSTAWGTYRSLDERWHIPCLPVTAFTLRRGWVTRTIETGKMPAAMRWTWRAKEMAPVGIRTSIRGAIHGRTRRDASGHAETDP